jgi:hypothetical protein
MDVHARVSILNYEDLVMDRSKTVRYGREIPCRNTRAHLPGEAAGASLKPDEEREAARIVKHPSPR